MLSSYLPFIIIGLSTGSAYALAALGLVLTYRTSGIFNFAYGGIAMVAAFAYYSLNVTAHVPTVYALLLAVLVIAPLFGVLLDRVVFRRLIGASVVGQVVCTVGLLILLQSLAVIIYGGNTITVAQFLPYSYVTVGSLNIGWNQIIIVIIALASAILLRSFYQYTKLGLNTRALVNNNELAELEGVRTKRVTSMSWAIGCGFAGLAGVLLVPAVGLDSTALSLIVVQAFGAAAFGGLTSLPWTYVGALVIGVVAAISTKWAATIPALTGLPSSLPFIALFVALIVMRKRGAITTSTLRLAGTTKVVFFRNKRVRTSVWIVWFAVLVLVPPLLSGSWLLGGSATAGFVVVFSGLYVVLGLSRQVSLCHGVFVATGVVTVSHLTTLHVPFVLALLAAGLISALVAVVVSVPAIRLSGLYFALATFAFGLLVEQLIWRTSIGFGVTGQVTVPRPWGLGSSRAYYWFMLAIAIGTVLLINRFVKSRPGRLSRALADSEIAVTSLGVRPAAPRVLIFSVSAFVAAIGGGLLGGLFGTVGPTQFNYSISLMLVAVLVTSGLIGQSGVVLAGVLYAGFPTVFTWGWLSVWSGVFFGFNAMVYANRTDGIVGFNRAQWEWAARQIQKHRTKVPAPTPSPPSATKAPVFAQLKRES